MQLLLQRDRRVMIRIDAGPARAGRTQNVVDGVGEKCANLVAECEIGVAQVKIHRRVPISPPRVARASARKPAVPSEPPATGTTIAPTHSALCFSPAQC